MFTLCKYEDHSTISGKDMNENLKKFWIFLTHKQHFPLYTAELVLLKKALKKPLKKAAKKAAKNPAKVLFLDLTMFKAGFRVYLLSDVCVQGIK